MTKAVATAPNKPTKYMDLTQPEIYQRAADEATHLAAKPMVNWKVKMQETDADMPRWMEDHIRDEHGGVSSNVFTQEKYNNKINLRATKPKV